ncbi:MAG: hypothetical protein RLY85_785 [Bacteroidota bacterium]
MYQYLQSIGKLEAFESDHGAKVTITSEYLHGFHVEHHGQVVPQDYETKFLACTLHHGFIGLDIVADVVVDGEDNIILFESGLVCR